MAADHDAGGPDEGVVHATITVTMTLIAMTRYPAMTARMGRIEASAL